MENVFISAVAAAAAIKAILFVSAVKIAGVIGTLIA